MIRKRLSLFALIGVSVAFAGSDPDFSGAWKLSTEQSEIRPQPRPPACRMTVKQIGARASYSLAVQDEDPTALWHVSVDGHENRDRFDDGIMNTVAKWEGAALLINTIVNGRSRSYTRMDRWQVSRDGKILTIHRIVVDRSGEVESSLVCEKS